MRSPILFLAAFAQLSFLSSAAPIDSTSLTSSIPESDLLPRTTYCTNYPSDAVGSHVSKRSEYPENSELVKRSQINWCREDTDYWISFATGGALGTKAEYGTIFSDALNGLQESLANGAGNNYTPSSHPVFLATDGGIFLFSYQSSPAGMTYARLKVFVEILQNYVYVKSNYQGYKANCYIGGTLVGRLTMSKTY